MSKYNEVYNNGSKHSDISTHPHVIVRKEPNDEYSCPHRRSIINQTELPLQSSLLYSDFVNSLLKDQSNNLRMSQERKKRSLSNEFPEEEDMDSIGSKAVGVTVETAVFVDETLYEIMRRTYPGLLLFCLIKL